MPRPGGWKPSAFYDSSLWTAAAILNPGSVPSSICADMWPVAGNLWGLGNLKATIKKEKRQSKPSNLNWTISQTCMAQTLPSPRIQPSKGQDQQEPQEQHVDATDERKCPEHNFRFLQTPAGVWTVMQAGLGFSTDMNTSSWHSPGRRGHGRGWILPLRGNG